MIALPVEVRTALPDLVRDVLDAAETFGLAVDRLEVVLECGACECHAAAHWPGFDGLEYVASFETPAVFTGETALGIATAVRDAIRSGYEARYARCLVEAVRAHLDLIAHRTPSRRPLPIHARLGMPAAGLSG